MCTFVHNLTQPSFNMAAKELKDFTLLMASFIFEASNVVLAMSEAEAKEEL